MSLWYTIFFQYVCYLFAICLVLYFFLLLYFWYVWSNIADFSLSGVCFGTDIIQKYTKWFQIGVHGLKIGQIFSKLQCALFLIWKRWKNENMGEKNTYNCSFSWNKSSRSYTGHTKGVKNRKKINQLNLINVVIYNHI